MGPGWWQAGDGLFYPPAGPPPKQGGGGTGCLIAAGIVGLIAVLGLGGCIAFVAIASDDVADEIDEAADEASQGADTGGGDDPNPGALFPGRPDTLAEDQEREVGEAARLSGYTTTVDAAAFQAQLSEFETSGYVVIDVTTENRDERAQPFNEFDWALQSPDGAVISPTLNTTDAPLGSGDLVGGGVATGSVVFDVGAQTGEFFIIYKPDPFDAARGIWSVEV
jgi:hypothetical protein